jgi:xanthine dehydrogenase small subunit
VTAVRTEIRFLLNDREMRLSGFDVSETLLDFLRLEQRLTGTKEGCAEGDCGACTVLVGRRNDVGAMAYETVTACIRLLASLDLCHVITIEYLSSPNSSLHLIQQAMVDHHGSQCGFCTPGIVISLYALWLNTPSPSREDVETALQGNLCRCTGYRPIIDAALTAANMGGQAKDQLMRQSEETAATLEKMADGRRIEIHTGKSCAIVPADVDDLADVLMKKPQATLVAGSTDVGLWVTKHMKDISPAVFIGNLAGLKQITVRSYGVTIGAGVTYSEFEPVIARKFPHLANFWQRIGGWQVRNMGTIGGNIANGSPIGDTPPALIALGASLTLRHGTERRTILLEDFYLEYGKQDCNSGEFIETIHIPLAGSDTLNAVYKVSKRRDEDISSVCAAFNVTVVVGKITAARIAFGGMAGVPKRAAHVEAALVGQPWSLDTIDQAVEEFSKDFEPLSDWRASAAYRALVAQNLLRRFILENDNSDTAVRLSYVQSEEAAL